MVRTTALVAATAALALNAHAEGLYSKKSAVTQITGMDYDRVIANSNYTSIVEFYAPWCGHCKNLKPAFEAAAKSLAGIAKVAAVNCDEEMNKPFCGRMGVQGFPTLKIVRPGKKPGKPTVEDYQGGRTAKAIVDAVKDKVPNSVKRINDKNLDSWLEENKDNAKAILFSDKGLVSATLRALAIDFSGLVSVAQIRKSEGNAVEKFGIEDFPSLILLPAGSEEPIKYDGEMQKEGMVKFLSQIAPPNPDCPPPKDKKSKNKKDTKKEKKDEKKEKKFSKSSAAHKESEASSAAASGKDETIEEANKPTESPSPEVEDTPKPVEIPEAEPTIPILSDPVPLHVTCLNDKSKTCIIALLPKDETSEDAKIAVASLASIHKKHDARASNLFPFVAVPASNPLSSTILTELSLGADDKVHLIATHGKRAWYKKYAGTTFGAQEVESWVDAIRMGEGKKEKLPDAVIASDATPPAEEKKPAEEEPVKIEIEELPDDDIPEHGEL